MELIDLFKYKALLAELETLKGKKKPIHNFIKKLYKMSNKFYEYSTLKKSENGESARYTYILATKAMTYDGSVYSIKEEIQRDLRDLRDKLMNHCIVTPENVLETYEFLPKNSTIFLRPRNIERLLKQDRVVKVLGKKYVSLSYYQIKEFKPFTHNESIGKILLLNVDPESPLAEDISANITKFETSFEEVESLINYLQLILKDKHEYISPSS